MCPEPAPFGRRLLECVNPVLGRCGVWLWGRDGHQHTEVALPRAVRISGADIHQVRGHWHWADPLRRDQATRRTGDALSPEFCIPAHVLTCLLFRREPDEILVRDIRDVPSGVCVIDNWP